jgi:hypothetical protein
MNPARTVENSVFKDHLPDAPETEGAVASAAPCSPPYLAEETVGEIIRWIDREHMNAAKEDPPNRDYMRAMQRLGKQVQDALAHYRKSKANTES